MPVWPGVVSPTPLPPGQFPAGSGIRVFDKDYVNPRVYAYNAAYEQQLTSDLTGYADVTWNEGRHLTRFLNYNRSGPSCCDQGPGTGNVYVYSGAPWGPQLGEVMVTNSRGSSRYRGLTLGLRKRMAAQLPGRGQLHAVQGRRRRLQRTRSVHGSQLQLLRPDEGLGACGSRHPAQVQRVRLFRPARAPAAQRARAVSRRPADHALAAHRER